jgi:hypothetical protein
MATQLEMTDGEGDASMVVVPPSDGGSSALVLLVRG